MHNVIEILFEQSNEVKCSNYTEKGFARALDLIVWK